MNRRIVVVIVLPWVATVVMLAVSALGCQSEGAHQGGSRASGATVGVQGAPDVPATSQLTAREPTTFPGGARFSEANVQRLNAFVTQQMKENNLPGAVVGVWVPGEGQYVVAKGKANLSSGAPRRLDQPFRIASISKTFTATAILQLVDEGKLKTSDKLSEWYPNFPNADKITIGDLLRMRSGIPDSANAEFLKYYYTHPKTDLTAQDMIERSAKMKDQFKPPNRETVYTNVNYYILEEIVGKVSGEHLGSWVTDKIFEPLGMNHSLYPTNDLLPGGLHGYSWDAKNKKFEDKTILNPAPAGGAGAIISTLPDLKIYAKALCTGTLLKPATQKARLRTYHMAGEPGFIRYGEGVARLGDFCGHNGTIFGFSSEMFYLPQKDAEIVVNVNRLDEDDQSKSTELLLGVTKILFPEYVDW